MNKLFKYKGESNLFNTYYTLGFYTDIVFERLTTIQAGNLITYTVIDEKAEK